MAKVETSRNPSPADKQAFKNLLLKVPLLERGAPLLSEINWILQEKPGAKDHQKILPEYCYNILDVFRKTYFKAFPSRSEIIKVTSKIGQLTGKNAVEIDMVKFGQLFGILDRCLRFVDMEATESLERDGLGNLSSEKTTELLTLFYGPKYLQENQSQFAGKSFDKIAIELLEAQIAKHTPTAGVSEFKINALAYQKGAESMADLNEGKSQGLTSFMDDEGQLRGESPRAGVYVFLAIVWPEIQEMLVAVPKRTLNDLHEWLKPFMRAGIMPFMELETLRDICEPPPRGIGISLRPLKSSQK
jgi:hypothetical protein